MTCRVARTNSQLADRGRRRSRNRAGPFRYPRTASETRQRPLVDRLLVSGRIAISNSGSFTRSVVRSRRQTRRRQPSQICSSNTGSGSSAVSRRGTNDSLLKNRRRHYDGRTGNDLRRGTRPIAFPGRWNSRKLHLRRSETSPREDHPHGMSGSNWEIVLHSSFAYQQ